MTLAALLLLLAGAGAGPWTAAQHLPTEPCDEYELKAEFIERFTRFITWPEGQWDDPTAAFVIAVTGLDPFGDRLERHAEHWRIKGRPVVIRRLDPGDDLEGIDVLFISSSEAGRLEEILDSTAARPILTVADSAGFGERGVLINFFTAKGSVHFEINQMAAARSGLELSSRLLKNARLVGPRRAGAFSPTRSNSQ